ncbi:MAG: murB [Paucimonas sp.]|nr:murB [Paucimonas sp.]
MPSFPAVTDHVCLRDFNTLGLEARAAHYLRVTDPAMLVAVAADARLKNLPRLVLGGGSNIVLTQDFPGLVLHMATSGIGIVGETQDAILVRAAAGENWHGLVCWTLAQALPGLENLALIPGSVGASPIQNIGAYGIELKDRFHSLTLLNIDTGEQQVLDAADCRFGYRDSIFKQGLGRHAVILDVTFALPRRWTANLSYKELAGELAARGQTEPSAQQVADAVIAIRQRKLPDPARIGNAGSFFKNPVVAAERRDALLQAYPGLVNYAQSDGSYKLAAGWMIEQCGWKGRSLGQAGVYEKQALVLVNRGQASGAEIMQLAEAINADVVSRFGVQLEPEPVVV